MQMAIFGDFSNFGFLADKGLKNVWQNGVQIRILRFHVILSPSNLSPANLSPSNLSTCQLIPLPTYPPAND